MDRREAIAAIVGAPLAANVKSIEKLPSDGVGGLVVKCYGLLTPTEKFQIATRVQESIRGTPLEGIAILVCDDLFSIEVIPKV